MSTTASGGCANSGITDDTLPPLASNKSSTTSTTGKRRLSVATNHSTDDGNLVENPTKSEDHQRQQRHRRRVVALGEGTVLVFDTVSPSFSSRSPFRVYKGEYEGAREGNRTIVQFTALEVVVESSASGGERPLTAGTVRLEDAMFASIGSGKLLMYGGVSSAASSTEEKSSNESTDTSSVTPPQCSSSCHLLRISSSKGQLTVTPIEVNDAIPLARCALTANSEGTIVFLHGGYRGPLGSAKEKEQTDATLDESEATNRNGGSTTITPKPNDSVYAMDCKSFTFVSLGKVPLAATPGTYMNRVVLVDHFLVAYNETNVSVGGGGGAVAMVYNLRNPACSIVVPPPPQDGEEAKEQQEQGEARKKTNEARNSSQGRSTTKGQEGRQQPSANQSPTTPHNDFDDPEDDDISLSASSAASAKSRDHQKQSPQDQQSPGVEQEEREVAAASAGGSQSSYILAFDRQSGRLWWASQTAAFFCEAIAAARGAESSSSGKDTKRKERKGSLHRTTTTTTASAAGGNTDHDKTDVEWVLYRTGTRDCDPDWASSHPFGRPEAQSKQGTRHPHRVSDREEGHEVEEAKPSLFASIRAESSRGPPSLFLPSSCLDETGRKAIHLCHHDNRYQQPSSLYVFLIERGKWSEPKHCVFEEKKSSQSGGATAYEQHQRGRNPYAVAPYGVIPPQLPSIKPEPRYRRTSTASSSGAASHHQLASARSVHHGPHLPTVKPVPHSARDYREYAEANPKRSDDAFPGQSADRLVAGSGPYRPPAKVRQSSLLHTRPVYRTGSMEESTLESSATTAKKKKQKGKGVPTATATTTTVIAEPSPAETAAQTIEELSNRQGVPERREVARAIVDAIRFEDPCLDLKEFQHLPIEDLVLLRRALSHTPKLHILDVSFHHFDEAESSLFVELLEEHAQITTLVAKGTVWTPPEVEDAVGAALFRNSEVARAEKTRHKRSRLQAKERKKERLRGEREEKARPHLRRLHLLEFVCDREMLQLVHAMQHTRLTLLEREHRSRLKVLEKEHQKEADWRRDLRFATLARCAEVGDEEEEQRQTEVQEQTRHWTAIVKQEKDARRVAAEKARQHRRLLKHEREQFENREKQDRHSIRTEEDEVRYIIFLDERLKRTYFVGLDVSVIVQDEETVRAKIRDKMLTHHEETMAAITARTLRKQQAEIDGFVRQEVAAREKNLTLVEVKEFNSIKLLAVDEKRSSQRKEQCSAREQEREAYASKSLSLSFNRWRNVIHCCDQATGPTPIISDAAELLVEVDLPPFIHAMCDAKDAEESEDEENNSGLRSAQSFSLFPSQSFSLLTSFAQSQLDASPPGNLLTMSSFLPGSRLAPIGESTIFSLPEDQEETALSGNSPNQNSPPVTHKPHHAHHRQHCLTSTYRSVGSFAGKRKASNAVGLRRTSNSTTMNAGFTVFPLEEGEILNEDWVSQKTTFVGAEATFEFTSCHDGDEFAQWDPSLMLIPLSSVENATPLTPPHEFTEHSELATSFSRLDGDYLVEYTDGSGILGIFSCSNNGKLVKVATNSFVGDDAAQRFEVLVHSIGTRRLAHQLATSHGTISIAYFTLRPDAQRKAVPREELTPTACVEAAELFPQLQEDIRLFCGSFPLPAGGAQKREEDGTNDDEGEATTSSSPPSSLHPSTFPALELMSSVEKELPALRFLCGKTELEHQLLAAQGVCHIRGLLQANLPSSSAAAGRSSPALGSSMRRSESSNSLNSSEEERGGGAGVQSQRAPQRAGLTPSTSLSLSVLLPHPGHSPMHSPIFPLKNASMAMSLANNTNIVTSQWSSSFTVNYLPGIVVVPPKKGKLQYNEGQGDGYLLSRAMQPLGLPAEVPSFAEAVLFVDMGPMVSQTDFFWTALNTSALITSELTVTHQDTVIGKVSQYGALFGHDLQVGDSSRVEINLTGSAKLHHVDSLLRSIVFRNDSRNPTDAARFVKMGLLFPRMPLESSALLSIGIQCEDDLTVIDFQARFPHVTYRTVGDPPPAPHLQPLVEALHRPLYFAHDCDVYDSDTDVFHSGYLSLRLLQDHVTDTLTLVPLPGTGLDITDDGAVIYNGDQVGTLTVKSPRCFVVNFMTTSIDASSEIIMNTSFETTSHAFSGKRTVEAVLAVETTTPVRSLCTVVVSQPLVVIPASQKLIYKEGVGNAKLLPTAEVCGDDDGWDGGFLFFEFVVGGTPDDKLFFAPPDDNVIVEFEKSSKKTATAGGLTRKSSMAPRPSVSFDVGGSFGAGASEIPTVMGSPPRSRSGSNLTLLRRRSSFAARSDAERNIRQLVEQRTAELEGRRREAWERGRERRANRQHPIEIEDGEERPLRINGKEVGTVISGSCGNSLLFKFEGSGSGVGPATIKRRDIAALLKHIYYKNVSANPYDLRKAVKVTAKDRGPHASEALVDIEVLADDNVTELIRASNTPLLFRALSAEDIAGFCLFADVSMHDPDTFIFNNSYLYVDLIAGGDSKGDQLGFLKLEEQHKRNPKGPFITAENGALHASGKLIGKYVLDAPNPENHTNVHIHFVPKPQPHMMVPTHAIAERTSGCVSLALVQRVLQTITYTSLSSKTKAGTRMYQVRAGFETAEGRLKLSLTVQPPLLWNPDYAASVRYQEGSTPVHMAPKICINISHDERVLKDLYLEAAIVEGTASPSDRLLIDVSERSEFNIREKDGVASVFAKGGKERVAQVVPLPQGQQQSGSKLCKLAVQTDWNCKATNKVMQSLARAISFVNDSLDPGSQERKVRFTLRQKGKADCTVFLTVDVLSVDNPTEIKYPAGAAEVIRATPARSVLPLAEVVDPDTDFFGSTTAPPSSTATRTPTPTTTGNKPPADEETKEKRRTPTPPPAAKNEKRVSPPPTSPSKQTAPESSESSRQYLEVYINPATDTDILEVLSAAGMQNEDEGPIRMLPEQHHAADEPPLPRVPADESMEHCSGENSTDEKKEGTAAEGSEETGEGDGTTESRKRPPPILTPTNPTALLGDGVITKTSLLRFVERSSRTTTTTGPQVNGAASGFASLREEEREERRASRSPGTTPTATNHRRKCSTSDTVARIVRRTPYALTIELVACNLEQLQQIVRSVAIRVNRNPRDRMARKNVIFLLKTTTVPMKYMVPVDILPPLLELAPQLKDPAAGLTLKPPQTTMDVFPSSIVPILHFAHAAVVHFSVEPLFGWFLLSIGQESGFSTRSPKEKADKGGGATSLAETSASLSVGSPITWSPRTTPGSSISSKADLIQQLPPGSSREDLLWQGKKVGIFSELTDGSFVVMIIPKHTAGPASSPQTQGTAASSAYTSSSSSLSQTPGILQALLRSIRFEIASPSMSHVGTFGLTVRVTDTSRGLTIEEKLPLTIPRGEAKELNASPLIPGVPRGTAAGPRKHTPK